ncbi:MAG: hypothetical protein RJA36_1472 [Pseudomonadota bacterium]|jgi:hypothetical protein
MVMDVDAMRELFPRLEGWLYPKLGNGKPLTIGEAAIGLGLGPELVLEIVDNHPWIFVTGDRSDPASMRLDADGE